jgi:hypothetical protein
MTVSFYGWKRERRYIIQCIWAENTDIPQENDKLSYTVTSVRAGLELIWAGGVS